MAVNCCATLFLIAASVLSADPGERLLRDLQGTWRADSIEFEGIELDPKLVLPLPYKEKEYRIEKDNLTVVAVVLGKEGSVDAKIKLDDATTPKSIDICWPDGTVLHGIYAVDGDVLVVCMPHFAKTKRPTKFTSRLDDHTAVYILRRQPR